MKIKEDGNNYPGWMRLKYKDKEGNRKKYYS